MFVFYRELKKEGMHSLANASRAVLVIQGVSQKSIHKKLDRIVRRRMLYIF